ncbi:ketopantoate reductase family protein [Acidisphaera sp. L21]|uniref:ketopantoate reductase family protein n=1 Tax=Acidisphaera sp. L21 TaxID=1641851 RepID=UPI00131BC2F7|nr:2-dehydropantoate 2-reductase N-terminal domain-containing protein [Acidisphaera sp. L21]
MTDRILIWGAGAIGGTVGAFLVKAGHDVTFVDIAADHLAAIRDPARGLAISGPVETCRISAPAFLSADLVGQWDHVYLCVKAHNTLAAAQALLPHLSPGGYVVSLQNGLCEDIIAGVVGRERTIGAFVNFSADWMGPGDIMFGGRGAFVLGELDGTTTDRLTALHGIIRSGFEPNAIITDDIQSYLWGKLSYAAMLFAQALGQLGIADCLARPELLPLWRDLGREVFTVAASIGVGQRGFNGFDPAAFAPGATEQQARASVQAMVDFNRPNAKTHSGIWRDLAIRKRRTEVDVQVAPVVEIGAANGIDCPRCRRLTAMIHEIEDGARPMTDDNLLVLMNG